MKLCILTLCLVLVQSIKLTSFEQALSKVEADTWIAAEIGTAADFSENQWQELYDALRDGVKTSEMSKKYFVDTVTAWLLKYHPHAKWIKNHQDKV